MVLPARPRIHSLLRGSVMQKPSLVWSGRLASTLWSAFITLAVATAVAQEQATAPKLTLAGHSDPVYAISFSPDGKYIVTGSFDKTVRLWNVADGKEVKK